MKFDWLGLGIAAMGWLLRLIWCVKCVHGVW